MAKAVDSSEVFKYDRPSINGHDILGHTISAKTRAKTVPKKLILSMVSLLQVDERGHIPHRKKRAFILTNEIRLLMFI